MLTLPMVLERKAQPYIAIRERVALEQMPTVVDRAFGTLFGWLGSNGLAPAGAPFFRYNLVDMAGKFEIDIAVPVTESVSPDGEILAGTLPAGNYGQVTWTGRYDALFDVNAVLVGWAREKGIRWDVEETPEGDRFAARLEIYENSPNEVNGPDELVTTVAIRIAD